MAGTVIWAFDDGFDRRVHLADLPEPARSVLDWAMDRYGYIEHGAENVYLISLDDVRFMNHSARPNVVVMPDKDQTHVALHDIVAGDELTCNYDAFGSPDPRTGWQPGDGAFSPRRLENGV